MAEIVEVVIRLPEKTYRKILSNEYDYGDMNVIIQAGTPLPKGHGRLIDADVVNSTLTKRLIAIDTAPTVIEADRESEVKQNGCCNKSNNI